MIGFGLGINRSSNIVGDDISLASVEPSSIFDLSAQIEASTDDANTYWRNLVPAPADGAEQGAYDFTYGQSSANTTGDPVLTGTAADAYYALNGSQYLTLETLPQFWKEAHKTTTDDFWVAISFRYQKVASSQCLWATNTTGVVPGLRINAFDNLLYLYQIGSSVTYTEVNVPLVDETDYILIWSHNKTTNTDKLWVNSATGTEYAHIFSSTTTDANAFTLAVAGNYVIPMVNGTRLYAFAGGNTYLDDTKSLAVQRAIADRQTEGRYPFL